MPPSYMQTWHKYDAYEVISAFQKCVRRGMEEDAIRWAYEMARSKNKAHYTWLWNRMKVIASEDVGPADFSMPILIDVLWRYWKEKKVEEVFFTNAVVALVRSKKSRIVDNAIHMFVSQDKLGRWENKPIDAECIREAALEKVQTPQKWDKQIPWFAIDKHTRAGKRGNLGMRDFHEVGSVIANQAMDDPYRERAVAGDLECEEKGLL